MRSRFIKCCVLLCFFSVFVDGTLAGCTVATYTNVKQRDTKAQPTYTTTEADCRTKCQHDSTCPSATFKKSSRSCWIHRRVIDIVQERGDFTYFLKFCGNTNQRSVKECEMKGYPNERPRGKAYRQSGNVGVFGMRSTTKCKNTCKHEPRCVASTFDGLQKKCYLHDRQGPTKMDYSSRRDYYRKHCEAKILKNNADPCYTNPCVGGATCKADGTSYHCQCTQSSQEYVSGQGCKMRNQCASNPCSRGASCRSVGDKYECHCPVNQHYVHGQGCRVINHCASNPCTRGASCRSVGDKYECHCQANQHYVHGQGCKVINQCASNPCTKGATCRSVGDKYDCHCPTNHRYVHGQGCIVIDHCASKPCSGNAKCRSVGAKYECDCPQNFYYVHGQGCKIINHCASQPCAKDSVCKSLGDKYECLCPWNHYYANGCKIKDPCASKPCSGGATCKATGGKFDCQCQQNQYYVHGQGCKVTDPCDSSPCSGHASCKSNGGAYQCQCPKQHDYFPGKGCKYVCIDKSGKKFVEGDVTKFKCTTSHCIKNSGLIFDVECESADGHCFKDGSTDFSCMIHGHRVSKCMCVVNTDTQTVTLFPMLSRPAH